MLHSRQHEHSRKPNCENRCPGRVREVVRNTFELACMFKIVCHISTDTPNIIRELIIQERECRSSLFLSEF